MIQQGSCLCGKIIFDSTTESSEKNRLTIKVIWNINGFVLVIVIGATYYPLVTFFTHTTTCTIYLYLSRGWAENLSLVKMLFKIKLNHHSALWHIYGQPFCFKPIFVWFINQGTLKQYDFSIKSILRFQFQFQFSCLINTIILFIRSNYFLIDCCIYFDIKK